MKSILTAILILTFAFVCFGQRERQKPFNSDWRLISVSKDKDDKIETIFAFKINSISKISPDIFKVWSKQFEVKTEEYSLDLFHINCSSKQYAIVQSIAYTADGDVIKSGSKPSADFKDAAPDSIAEETILMVCKEVEK